MSDLLDAVSHAGLLLGCDDKMQLRYRPIAMRIAEEMRHVLPLGADNPEVVEDVLCCLLPMSPSFRTISTNLNFQGIIWPFGCSGLQGVCHLPFDSIKRFYVGREKNYNDPW